MALTLRINEEHRRRAGSAAGVAAVHALLLYALLRGLGFEVPAPIAEQLKLIDFAEERPPPTVPPPPEKVKESKKAKPKDPEGAASPPNLKDTPTQIVAPKPEIAIPVPPPIPAAPVAGLGNAPAAGAAEIVGPGTGRGGQGNGLGSGAFGTGSGGGGGGLGRGRRARHISGGIGPRDFLPGMTETLIVHMRFTVTPNGRVRDCRVTRTSGNRELDSTTCRLLERRLRYRPALDGEGRPTTEVINGTQLWGIRPRAEPAEEETFADEDY
jgi:protein TonB